MRFALVLLVSLFAVPVLANVEVAPRSALLVLVRNDVGGSLQEPMLRRALVTARDLWRPHAEVTFTGANDVRRYTRPTLDLVITPNTLPGTGENRLGWTEFVNGRASRTVTVSFAAARTMMATSKWNGRPLQDLPPRVQELFLSRALGRAIAHEVGHYLLNSPAHPASGLMRERMTASDIMLDHRPGELFDASEIARLRGRLEELARDAGERSTDGTL